MFAGQSATYDLRQQLHISNRLTAYVYLLDPQQRVRAARPARRIRVCSASTCAAHRFSPRVNVGVSLFVVRTQVRWAACGPPSAEELSTMLQAAEELLRENDRSWLQEGGRRGGGGGR